MEKQKEEKQQKSEKTCFVIMPISDMDGYESGHFYRVYKHLISYACEKAGYKPIRADDVAASNYIIIDILQKIIESDLVICDLSGKNPNVMYELGIRQAFNLPTVLLKDKKTSSIFDISGLRYVEYNESLRVDTIDSGIAEVVSSITETIGSKGKHINSVVELIGIKPAHKPAEKEISSDTALILDKIESLSQRISSVEKPTYKNPLIEKIKIKEPLLDDYLNETIKRQQEELQKKQLDAALGHFAPKLP